MTIIKEIRTFCNKCKQENIATDNSTDFEKFYEMEDCENCLSLGVDAL